MVLGFRAGARFETLATCGLSHFLEHALHVPRPFHALEALGGDLEASTSDDDCEFGVALPPESLERGSALLAELVLRQPSGPHVEVERERVLEEILGLAPDERLDDVARREVFRGDPLGMPVLGDADRVTSFDLHAIGQWHAGHVVARNSVVVFAGPISPAEALRLAERDWGSMPGGERAAVTAPAEQTELRYRGVRDSGDETDVRVCFRAPANRPALEALRFVLDDGDGSRLMRGERVGRCYAASAALWEYEGTSYLGIAVSHREPAPVVAEVLSVLSELARRGPTSTELDRMRRRLVWSRRAMHDSGTTVAEHYAREALLNRDPMTLEKDTQRLVGVTAAQVRDVARGIVRPERLTVIASGPHPRARSAVRRVAEAWRGARW